MWVFTHNLIQTDRRCQEVHQHKRESVQHKLKLFFGGVGRLQVVILADLLVTALAAGSQPTLCLSCLMDRSINITNGQVALFYLSYINRLESRTKGI